MDDIAIKVQKIQPGDKIKDRMTDSGNLVQASVFILINIYNYN